MCYANFPMIRCAIVDLQLDSCKWSWPTDEVRVVVIFTFVELRVDFSLIEMHNGRILLWIFNSAYAYFAIGLI